MSVCGLISSSVNDFIEKQIFRQQTKHRLCFCASDTSTKNPIPLHTGCMKHNHSVFSTFALALTKDQSWELLLPKQFGLRLCYIPLKSTQEKNKSFEQNYIKPKHPTAVTLDLMPCQKDLVSYWFWVVSVFHTRIMLSPTPSARHPAPTGEKVRE